MAASFDASRVDRFRYLGWDLHAGPGELRFSYSLDDEWAFQERVLVGAGHDWSSTAALEAVRLAYLLSGVSYYKAAAPPVIDLGKTPLRSGELEFLRSFYLEGLGEFAFRNDLDLSGLEITGGVPAAPPAPYEPASRRPLIPFGGGIDSIVTVETVRPLFRDSALFVVSPPGQRFAAIEDAAAVTGLGVVRAERQIDPQLLRSHELGFRNGHVPITGIISSLAVLLGVLGGRDAVIMSNEWSASIGRRDYLNHQYSKSAGFETAFRRVLAGAFESPIEYFSMLRSMSTLAIGRRFAELERYHPVFRSCNRAFHLEVGQRMSEWCGVCDKCCFVDLVLAPFLSRDRLSELFAGREPLENDGLLEQFRTLLGISAGDKPFECVGDIEEARAAAQLAAKRPDRAWNAVLAALRAELAGHQAPDPASLMLPMGPNNIPEAYAPADILV